MTYLLRTCLLAVLLFPISKAEAFTSPLGISLIPPVQFPTSEFAVTGLRVSAIYGHHRDFYGVDIGGFGNITDQDFVGIGISGLFNNTRGATTIFPLQLAGGVNYNTGKTSVTGFQVAGGINYNETSSKVIGFQIAGLANVAKNTKIYGFQIGFYNKALKVNGFQIGIINMAKDVNGLQIGLINFHNNGVFAVSPIINFGF